MFLHHKSYALEAHKATRRFPSKNVDANNLESPIEVEDRGARVPWDGNVVGSS